VFSGEVERTLDLNAGCPVGRRGDDCRLRDPGPPPCRPRGRRLPGAGWREPGDDPPL